MDHSSKTIVNEGEPSGCWSAQELASPRKIVHVSAAAMVDIDGRILIAQRPKDKAFADLWEFPGGKVEAGETPEQTLIRELNEELGIETQTSCLAPLAFASHRYDDVHLVMLLYACRIWQGEPEAIEHQALKWVRVENLKDYPMPAADLPLLPFLRELL